MRRASWIFVVVVLGAGCVEGMDPGEQPEAVEAISAALTGEDGLANAYAQFKQQFVGNGFDQVFPIGYGFQPALVTETLAGGRRPKGKAQINFAQGRVTATLEDLPSTGSFDLWFVKNVAGSGRTVKPETGDQFVKIGTFTKTTPTGGKSLDLVVGTTKARFDLDLLVVTRKDQHPTASRIAVGARTLFEKRFSRERAGLSLDPVSGTVAKDVETTDQLVGRGAQLFFRETFAGNGRTCGTCHRAERNLTIDAAFIATLPQSDPLFVAENNPALAQLENPQLLRSQGLILENVDGFENPTGKFVMRSVPHTFALNQTNGFAETAFNTPPFAPPDQRLGWAGDGAPGRGTLLEFSLGAVVQHFTKNLARRPGTDFRTPTQEELDALEAFQLFSGRQKLVNALNLGLREARAARGKDLFFGQGQCTLCHEDLSGSTGNFLFNTGVADLTSTILPPDDGFLNGAGGNVFNAPPLLEAADSAPFFHNNSKSTIEAAVNFYTTETFQLAIDGFEIILDDTQQADLAAFLRVVNAAENIRQVRKRVTFIKNNRSTGNTAQLTVALADTRDAIRVLREKSLNQGATNDLATVENILVTAQANPDSERPAFMDQAIIWLNLAKAELFTANPDNLF
jgi:cytochrome c peroxidase